MFRVVALRASAARCASALARHLLTPSDMLVDAVFQYRTLQGKCDLGLGLDWDEIEQLSGIETMFSTDDRGGRRFRRERVQLVGTMRGDRINDRIDIVELAP